MRGKSEERISKVEALRDRSGTAGERQAAETALARINADVEPRQQQPLTDASVRRLPTPATGNRVYWDAGGVGGFGCRVTAAGSRAYVLDYRVRGTGRQRRYTIGAAGDWTAGAARIEARKLRRKIDEGGDPLADLEADRAAPTVSELIARFEREHLSRRRASTAADYKSMIANHIAPALSTLKVAEVAFRDIDRLHHKITAAGYPYRANRVVAVLSKMFALAVRWGMCETNPCKGIEKNLEHHRRRYLKSEELVALLKALGSYSDQRIANAFRLLLMTGARRGEVLSMRWADIDLTKGIWSKSPSSTKQKQMHEVPLSAPVKQLLMEIRQRQTANRQPLPEFVFPGSGERGHVVEIKRAWARLCKTAGLKDLRIHDLRHSFASALASDGASLPLIGALLGHSNPQTTSRYAHLFDDPMRAAAERVGAAIAAAAEPPSDPRLKPRGARHKDGW
jgi:integrase